MKMPSDGGARYMRMMVFFDIPVRTKKERFFASRFRRDLLNDGFTMLQYSVYCRICKGLDSVKMHLLFLSKIVPPKGSVRVLTITDSQYARMQILVGEKKLQEKTGEQLLLF